MPAIKTIFDSTGENSGRNLFCCREPATTPPKNEYVVKEGDCTTPKYIIDLVEKKSWTNRDERNFLAFARKEALDTITEVESIDLEKLERMRNALNSQRSYREILAAKLQFEKADKLIHALNEYLETTY